MNYSGVVQWGHSHRQPMPETAPVTVQGPAFCVRRCLMAEVVLTVEHCGKPVTGLCCPWCNVRSGVAWVMLICRRPVVTARCLE